MHVFYKGMPRVIVLDENSLHCLFLQMRNLSLPDLFLVSPEQVTYANVMGGGGTSLYWNTSCSCR